MPYLNVHGAVGRQGRIIRTIFDALYYRLYIFPLQKYTNIQYTQPALKQNAGINFNITSPNKNRDVYKYKWSQNRNQIFLNAKTVFVIARNYHC